MYIDPFWAGVLSTLMAEFSVFFVFVFVSVLKFTKKK